MRILEFKDEHNNIMAVPLFTSFFKGVDYPLGIELTSAQLITNDNMILNIVGTDFKIIKY